MSRTFRRCGPWSFLAISNRYIMRGLKKGDFTHAELHACWQWMREASQAKHFGLPDRAIFGKAHRDCMGRDKVWKAWKRARARKARHGRKAGVLALLMEEG